MAAEPQIVVAFHSELEELVERNFACRSAGANLCAYLVIVSSRARKPMRPQRAASRYKRSEPGCQFASGPRFRGRIQRKAPFRNAQQISLRAHPSAERIPAIEIRPLEREACAIDVAKIAIGGFRAGAPTPAPVYNGVEFRADGNSAQV